MAELTYIEHLNIPVKYHGNILYAYEYNATVGKINEIIDSLHTTYEFNKDFPRFDKIDDIFASTGAGTPVMINNEYGKLYPITSSAYVLIDNTKNLNDELAILNSQITSGLIDALNKIAQANEQIDANLEYSYIRAQSLVSELRENVNSQINDIETSINNIDIATNNTVGLVKGGLSRGTTMGVSIDSNGAMTVAHYTPIGRSKTATTSGGESLVHDSSLVVTGLSYSVDANGHVTALTATTGKLPADTNTDTKVEFTSTTDDYKYPLIFKYSTGDTTTANAVRFDSVTDSAYYVASTHSAYINTTYHAASYLAGNEMAGFKTINSTMNTLLLFSSSGAPSTLGVMFRDRYNNVILPVTSSDMIEVNYGGTSKILTSLLQENEHTTAGALNDLYNRIVELENRVAKLEKNNN